MTIDKYSFKHDEVVKFEEQINGETRANTYYPVNSIHFVFPDSNPDMIRVTLTYNNGSQNITVYGSYYSANKHDFNSMLMCVNTSITALQNGAFVGYAIDDSTNIITWIRIFTDIVS